MNGEQQEPHGVATMDGWVLSSLTPWLKACALKALPQASRSHLSPRDELVSSVLSRNES